MSPALRVRVCAHRPSSLSADQHSLVITRLELLEREDIGGSLQPPVGDDRRPFARRVELAREASLRI